MRSLEPAPWPLRQGEDRLSEHAGIHDHCFACGRSVDGLGLEFVRGDEDSVRAEWFCHEAYQSYPDIIHGGIIATLLDSAMTNCLLLKGIEAVTAELNIRYRSLLCVGRNATLTARMVHARSALYILEAEVRQDDVTVATARGKFMGRKSAGA